MEQGFPPEPLSVATMVRHGVLLALAVAAVVGLVIQFRRPARVSNIVWWAVAAVVAMVLCGAGSPQGGRFRSFLVGDMLFIWAVAGVGCLVSVVRLSRVSGGSAALGCFLTTVLALGLFVVAMAPMLGTPREVARRVQCKNNLRQTGIALFNWLDIHGRYPDAAHREPDQPPRSWRVALLPFVEQDDLSKTYDAAQAWDDPVNLPVARTHVFQYVCPSQPDFEDEQGRCFTSYVAVTGPGTAFPDGKGLPLAEFTDGLSDTLMVAEACGRNIVWTDPADFDAARDPFGVNLRGQGQTDSPGMLSSYHKTGAHALVADGSVRFLNQTIDPAVLRALTTPAGGEKLPDDWDQHQW